MDTSCNMRVLAILAITLSAASHSITEQALALDGDCGLQVGDSQCHLGLVQGKAEALRRGRQISKSAGPEGTCKVEGNPDTVVGFDQGHTSWLHFFLSFFHLASDDGTAVSEDGDVWLVKSPEVLIQGRYNSNQKGRSLHGIAVSGPVIDDNIIMIGTLKQKVSWNDEEILEEPVSSFSVKDIVNASRSDALKDNQLHDEIEIELASGLKLLVKRRIQDLDVSIAMLPSVDGQDGQCGNFNGNPDDDTAELIADRFELHVNEDVLLFTHEFSGKVSRVPRHSKMFKMANPHAQFVAGKTSMVAPHACAKDNQPAQIFRGPFNGHSSEFELKTLDPALGTYSTLYTIPYTRTTPRFIDMNSCDISPISSIVYCSLTMPDGADYLVRVDATQIEFVAKLPDSKHRYVAGAFGKSGNFHLSEGGFSEVQLATIYAPDGLVGFADQNDRSLTDYTNLPTTTVPKVADWVAFEADIQGTGKSEWLLGIKNSTVQSVSEVILVDTDSQKVYHLNALGLEVDGSTFGAGWNFKNRLFFASNDGDGVYEVSTESIDIDGKEVVLEKVGASARVRFNDGLNCISAPAPASWDSCLLVTKEILKGSMTRKDCGPPANECKLVYKKHKRTTFCLQTTTTTTNPLAMLGECTIYGDPHVVGFDKAPAQLSFVALNSSSEGEMSSSEFGDKWLVRSKQVLIQGRYNIAETSYHKRPFLRGLVVGGPFLHNNTLLIGAGNSNKVFWNHEEILASIPSQYENSLMSASIYMGAKLVQDPTQTARAPGVDVDLPLGISLHMTQGKNGLGVKISMPPMKGGQDGLCGNFNGIGADDTAELISTRLGGEVSTSELLFRHPFA